MQSIRVNGKVSGVAAVAACLAGFALPASAQTLGDRFWIEAQVFRPAIDTNAKVSRAGSPGTDIDFENDLGLKDTDNLPAVRAGARWGRWFVAGEYYALKRDASRALSRDIVFDGVTYPATATIDSEFDSKVYRASIGYMFFQRDTWELGATVGLHATDFSLATRGTGQVAGGPVRETESRKKDFLAPLPTIGAVGSVQLGNRWLASGRADYLSLSLGDYGGGILNLEGDIGYKITDNIALGAGFRHVGYDLDVDKSDYEAKIDYGFSGPFIFARATFR